MTHTPFTTRLLGLAACGVLAVGLSACESDNIDQNADLIAGKQAFVQKCGACHTLARAGTKGVAGPNLDEAFRQSLADGFGRDTIDGVVEDQILHPARLSTDNPVYMPANLVSGRLVGDVASYVAAVAARPGKDAGKLATAVKAAGEGKPVAAKGGVLALPADPDGQLAYISKEATAPAGALEIDSKNASSIPHDISIEGNGVDAKGKTVVNGATSSVKVTLKPGTYTFYCSVTGHREGGMVGKLTVK